MESIKPLDYIDETLKKLIELQKADSGRDELEHLKKNFQKEIESLENGVAALKTQIQNEKKSMDDLLKGRKTLEIEVGSLDTKIAKYQGQTNEVKSNEQFAALKLEIEKSKEDKNKSEEKVLNSLFQEDDQKKKIQNLTGELAQAEKKAATEKIGLQQKITDCDKAALDKEEERKKKLLNLPPEYAENYEALRHSGKKVAVAEAQEDHTCSACHMNIAPQVVHQIRKGVSIERCNCGRYLYLKD
ncbi:MAG TPA: hypothetical protein VIJ93_09395 [bacterium]